MNENTTPVQLFIMTMISAVIMMILIVGLFVMTGALSKQIQGDNLPTIKSVENCYYQQGKPYCVVKINEGWDF